MVEVFKTNIREEAQANRLIQAIIKTFPTVAVNFDLEDCDKILKVKGKNFKSQNIIKLVNDNGYHCEILV